MKAFFKPFFYFEVKLNIYLILYNLFLKYFLKKLTRIFPILIFIVILLYVYFNGNFQEIVNHFIKLKFNSVIFAFILISMRPFIDTLRWHVVTKLFTSTKFMILHRATIIGFSINQLGITTIGVEASKFAVIRKELGTKKTFALLVVERVITGFIKILFVFFAALFFFKAHIYFFYLLYIFFAVIFIFVILIILIKNNKLIIKYVQRLKDYFLNIINCIEIVRHYIVKIVFIGILCQFYNIFLYITVFYVINVNINIIDIFLIVPLIELAAQIAIIIPAAHELATIAIFSHISLTFETALFIALFYRVGDIFGIGLNTLLIEIHSKIKKIN